MELTVLLIFCAALIGCLLAGTEVIIPLLFGLLLFSAYTLIKGRSFKDLFKMFWDGIKGVRIILILFVLVGTLTASWRSSGTIAVIISFAVKLVKPQIFLLMAFLLNCGVSLLIGTAFGTVATMGVICGAMGVSLGIDPFITGGTILAGCYFGDRCSPVSTSAILVAECTKTDLYENIRRMFKTAFIPFLISCGIYILLGLKAAPKGEIPDLSSVFGTEYVMSPVCAVPAVLLILLAVFRVKALISISCGSAMGVILAIVIQKLPAGEALLSLLTGFTAKDPEVGAMMNGGGVLSMLNCSAIIILSACYAGIFNGTGLLNGIRGMIERVSCRVTPFAGSLMTGILTAMITCNQTLSIVLTSQLTEKLYTDKYTHAIDICDSAVVIAPVIPWSIAGTIPLAAVGVTGSAVIYSCYLYIVPLYRLIVSIIKKALSRKAPR